MFRGYPEDPRKWTFSYRRSTETDKAECVEETVASDRRLQPSAESIPGRQTVSDESRSKSKEHGRRDNPDENNKGSSNQCSLCPDLYLIKRQRIIVKILPNDPELFKNLFHLPCTKCQTHQPSTSVALCPFCKHLNLPHLIECLLPIWQFTHYETSTRIVIKPRKAIASGVSQCVWCKFLYGVVSRNAKYYARNDSDIQRAHVGRILDSGHVLLEPRNHDHFEISIGLIGTRDDDFIRHFAKVEVIRPGWEIKVRETLGEQVDWKFIKDYLEACEKHREPYTQEWSLELMPNGFMLIDVRKGYLVRPSRSCRYAALSYLWGRAQPKKGDMTTSKTLASFRSKGRLFQSDIPVTIRDALIVCRQLGVPYLWVDRFCIVQDIDTKHNQIQQMGHIYASSTLTIVAGSGEDANYGLPGVFHRLRELPAKHLVIGRHEFMEFLPSTSRVILPASPWPKRGWTFQEATLSRALVVFTDDGVCFESPHLRGTPFHDEGGVESGAILRFDYDYTDAVSEYTGRTLTYESDILEAFSGYMGRSYGTNHLAGLPLDDIDTAVLWRSVSKTRYRISSSDTFPTWSWASVFGRVSYGRLTTNDNAFTTGRHFHAPIGTWQVFKPDSNGLCEFIGLEPSGTRQWELRWGPYHACSHLWMDLVAAWREGCFPGNIPSVISECKTWYELQRPFLFRYPTYKSFWLESRGLSEKESPSKFKGTLSRSEIDAASIPDRLVIHSQVLPYSLESYDSCIKRDFCELFLLRDQDGCCAGTIHLDSIHARTVNHVLGESNHFSAEFVAIALREDELLCDIDDVEYSPTKGNWEYLNKESRDPLIYQSLRWEKFLEDMNYPGRLQNIPPPVLAVMMIGSHGEAWRRMGIGHVFLKQWVKSRPSFRSVVLE